MAATGGDQANLERSSKEFLGNGTHRSGQGDAFVSSPEIVTILMAEPLGGLSMSAIQEKLYAPTALAVPFEITFHI